MYILILKERRDYVEHNFILKSNTQQKSLLTLTC